MKTPKVFISYSWTDQFHKKRVKKWANRLMDDGIEVILDTYDLKVGDDKHAFMERMVTDSSVTHVLVICDKEYADKADDRKAGVGTESQIISGEVYEKVEQSKFIPIVCEFGKDKDAILPVFMKSRKWIDFSSPKKVNKNWEQLVRLLYGKPQYAKPEKGKTPIYITNDAPLPTSEAQEKFNSLKQAILQGKKGKTPGYITNDAPLPTSEAQEKFNSLKQAILQGKKGINLYRSDFIESCIKYADALRVRKQPAVESMGEKVLEDCGKLKAVRDLLCNWILLEGEVTDSKKFSESVIDVLERLRELKSRPPEVTRWNHSWFEAHAVFVYETFLYIIAACLKTGTFSVLHDIYSSHYLLPSTDRHGNSDFERFDCFLGRSNALQSVLAPEGQKLYAPAAELIKRQADREDIPFRDILQAELLTLLMSVITPDTHWYPQTLHYLKYESSFPFFIRAAQHKHFKKLSKITGIESADELKIKIKAGYERVAKNQWYDLRLGMIFSSSMNMKNFDTLI